MDLIFGIWFSLVLWFAELQNLGGHFALESWTVPTCALKNVHIDRNGTGSYFKQQVQETMGSLKQKQIVKLCDIYADWLEDMIILPSPSYKWRMVDFFSKRWLEETDNGKSNSSRIREVDSDLCLEYWHSDFCHPSIYRSEMVV